VSVLLRPFLQMLILLAYSDEINLKVFIYVAIQMFEQNIYKSSETNVYIWTMG